MNRREDTYHVVWTTRSGDNPRSGWPRHPRIAAPPSRLPRCQSMSCSSSSVTIYLPASVLPTRTRALIYEEGLEAKGETLASMTPVTRLELTGLPRGVNSTAATRATRSDARPILDLQLAVNESRCRSGASHTTCIRRLATRSTTSIRVMASRFCTVASPRASDWISRKPYAQKKAYPGLLPPSSASRVVHAVMPERRDRV